MRSILAVLFLSVVLVTSARAMGDEPTLRGARPNGVTITFGDGSKPVYSPAPVSPLVTITFGGGYAVTPFGVATW